MIFGCPPVAPLGGGLGWEILSCQKSEFLSKCTIPKEKADWSYIQIRYTHHPYVQHIWTQYKSPAGTRCRGAKGGPNGRRTNCAPPQIGVFWGSDPWSPTFQELP